MKKAKNLLKDELLFTLLSLEKITQFFSTSSIEELFNTLGIFAEKVTTEFNFSHEEYSVTLNILEEESRVSLCVNILQVEDKE